jgi:hypothetical protein
MEIYTLTPEPAISHRGSGVWRRSMQPFCTLRAIFGFHRPGALSGGLPKAYK